MSSGGSGRPSVALGHLVLVGGERTQDQLLLGGGDAELVERPLQLGRDLVELLGRDPELPVRLLEAQRRGARTRAGVLERATRDGTHPERALELQAGEPRQVVRVPLTQLRVLRLLADDRVVDQRITELIDDRRDGEGTTQPVVQGRLGHGLTSPGVPAVPGRDTSGCAIEMWSRLSIALAS